MTGPMKVILALVVIVLIGLGFWLLDWQGKQAELSSLRSTLAERTQHLRRTRELARELPRLVAENEALTAQLEQLSRAGFQGEDPQAFVAHVLQDLERLVVDQRLRTGDRSFEILGITPGAEVRAAADDEGLDEPLPTQPTRSFQLTMRGRYTTLMDFLYRLGSLELERLVTVDKIALAPAGGATEGPPVLSITVPITAYSR